MTQAKPDTGLRHVAAAFAIATLVAACAAPQPASSPTPKPAESTPSAPAPAAPAPPVETRAPAPAPVDPAIARPQAQKLALEAVDQLQNGDEAAARATLERAAALDPSNDLVRKLSEQIRADAQKELGGVFFRYTVQKDDTLSKLAQQYLGDRYRFYVLAKYNDIANPSRLGAGQVIKIPGRAPPPGAAPALDSPATPAVAQEAKPRDDLAELLQKGAALEKAGNVEGAYLVYNDALARAPGNAEVTKRRDAARANLIRAYDREATQAFQRQNLDLAITKWDRILELDPANRKARLERERAIDLQKRMQAKFGNKPQ